MENNTFFTLLRTYAAQARRRGVSYGSQVYVLFKLREKSIFDGEGTEDEKHARVEALRRAVSAEYVPFDPSFDLLK